MQVVLLSIEVWHQKMDGCHDPHLLGLQGQIQTRAPDMYMLSIAPIEMANRRNYLQYFVRRLEEKLQSAGRSSSY